MLTPNVKSNIFIQPDYIPNVNENVTIQIEFIINAFILPNDNTPNASGNVINQSFISMIPLLLSFGRRDHLPG
jgi:hypothetical protein